MRGWIKSEKIKFWETNRIAKFCERGRIPFIRKGIYLKILEQDGEGGPFGKRNVHGLPKTGCNMREK